MTKNFFRNKKNDSLNDDKRRRKNIETIKKKYTITIMLLTVKKFWAAFGNFQRELDGFLILCKY